MFRRQAVAQMKLSRRALSCRTCLCDNKHAKRIAMEIGAEREATMNDNDQKPVTIITGRVARRKGDRHEGVHIMLVAADDDAAVRTALDALAKEGYAEAELDQIGDLQGRPDEEPHASAYQGALEGEVSIVTFEEDF